MWNVDFERRAPRRLITERSHRLPISKEAGRFLEGSAELHLADGRRAPVSTQLSISRTFFSLRGDGFFTCRRDIAFDAMDSSCWLKLVFCDGPVFDISIYELRSSEQETRCWFEVHA